MTPRGEPFDEAAGTTSERDNASLFDVDIMDMAERFSIDRLHLCIVQLAQSHQSAPQLGIQRWTSSSTTCRPTSSPRHFSLTTLPISAI
jgi:hypothetical protein